MDRLHEMERENPVRGPAYHESLSTAARRGIAYGIEVLAVGVDRAGEPPPVVTEQARAAARHRIPPETAMRRYTAAERRLARHARQKGADIDPQELEAALSSLDAAFERLIATVADEYRRVEQSRPGSLEARKVARARRLLAGEPTDPSMLEYDLGGHHLGLVAGSAEAQPLLRRLARDLGCNSLLLPSSPNELWAWLGSGREPIDAGAVREWLAAEIGPEERIGLGEPKHDRHGWRLTHNQAQGALWVARARQAPMAEYSEVGLLASIAGDPLMTTSLHERFLEPLSSGPDGGELRRQTLLAYFRADKRSGSAGPMLGVSRQTVGNRIKKAEELIGQQLEECGQALRIALELEELGFFSYQRDSLL